MFRIIVGALFYSTVLCATQNNSGVNKRNFVYNTYKYDTRIVVIVNDTTEQIMDFYEESEIWDGYPTRVHVSTDEMVTVENPVFVTATQQKGISSWEIPLLVQTQSDALLFSDMSRTLCPHDAGPDIKTENRPMIQITTSNPQNVSVNIKLRRVTNFYVDVNKEVPLNVTPSSPKYFYFSFDQHPWNISKRNPIKMGPRFNYTIPKSVILIIDSDDDVCATVSIQNNSCPVFDSEKEVFYKGHHLTMMSKGGITLTQTMFPYGFYIVFIVNENDDKCTGVSDSTRRLVWNDNRTKSFRFRVIATISYREYVVGALVTLALVCAVAVLVTVAVAACTCRCTEIVTIVGPDLEPVARPSTSGEASTAESAPILDDTDDDGPEDDQWTRSNPLTVQKLTRAPLETFTRRSNRYFWGALTVAVVYALPVVQLLFTYQRMVVQTGDQDLCYYNYLCAHPLGFLSDFNHVYSNVGYVVLGLVFLAQVRHRQVKNRSRPQNMGVPQHYGLLYSMGLGLVMEGLLSGCYHLCPNKMNFQFDSSFMYVIAVLVMIKLYQNRHSDIIPYAHTTFMILAIIMTLGLFGILFPSVPFSILFTILHMMTCSVLTLKIYYAGNFNLGKFFNYTIPKSVILIIDSDDDVCATVSIQNNSCPVFDSEKEVFYKGHHLTMMSKGGITLTQTMFPYGFYIVFIVNENDDKCTGVSDSTRRLVWNDNRTKSFRFRVIATISYREYVVGALVTLALVCAVAVLVTVAVAACTCRCTEIVTIVGPDLEPVARPSTSGEASTAESAPILDDTDDDGPEDDQWTRSNPLTVQKLTRAPLETFTRRSNRYFWGALTVAVVYALPVVQLLFTYQRMVVQTGDQDLCYYNYLCAHPLGFLSDFNHVYSNVGYVVLGLVFLAQVRHRQVKNRSRPQNMGVPQHYGLLYSMGLGLVMEGLLSGCYHLCPNKMNFQFDSSFMYVIAVLVMIKLYQNRHSDIIPYAHTTFMILAIIMTLGLFGILFPSVPFSILFTILHMMTCSVLTLKIYYAGNFNLELSALARGVRALRSDSWRALLPARRARAALVCIANIANWAFAIYRVFSLFLTQVFARQLLAILMGKAILYTMFYVIMKLYMSLSSAVVHNKDFARQLLAILMGNAILYAMFYVIMKLYMSLSSAVVHNKNFARQLLAILVGNAILYAMFYVIMKLYMSLSSAVVHKKDFARQLLAILMDHAILYAMFYVIMKLYMSLSSAVVHNKDFARLLLAILMGNAILYAMFYVIMKLYMSLSSAVVHNKDFARQLLAILMGNAILYTMFYLIMKLVHRERIAAYTWFYFVLAHVAWFSALKLFLDSKTKWSQTPAQSRRHNAECSILQLYDTHDAWHIMSAAAMFLSFNMLLTVDDLVANTLRETLHTF